MAKRTKATSKAPKARHTFCTRKSAKRLKGQPISSTGYPPKPYVEDTGSGEDKPPTRKKPRASQSYASFTALSSAKHPYHRSSDAYQADTESATGQRRFSDLYGHGHRFVDSDKTANSSSIPFRPVLNDNSKRKLSQGSDGTSPKKVRFSPRDNQTKVFERGSVPSPRWPKPSLSHGVSAVEEIESDHTLSDLDATLMESMRLPENPDHHLLNLLHGHPQRLSLSQISGLFHVIQDLTEEFSRLWFGRAANDNHQELLQDMLSFPIQDLEMQNPALYLTTMNVLDASTTDGVNSGWLKFFGHPDYRHYLIYAILGEWFTQRIFKDTSFGLPPIVQQKMHEDVDVAYLHYESFIRAKERSKIIAQFTGPESATFNADCLEREAGKLADELLTVLSPMLPGHHVAHQQDRPQDPFSKTQEGGMRHALVELISHCAAFNWSVVRSGEDGTIIRIADRLENGKRFWPTAPMRCINQDMVDMAHDSNTQDAVPVVKMTCWARVEAFVPHGMDMVQMAVEEEESRKRHDFDAVDKLKVDGKTLSKNALNKAHNKFCWECFNAEAWDVLPTELWPNAQENNQKMERRMKNADLRNKLERTRVKQQSNYRSVPVPDDSESDSSLSASSNSDESSSSSTSDSDMHCTEGVKRKASYNKNEPLRGSWITYYSCLNPHQVYCEWAKPEPAYQAELKLKTGIDAEEPIRRYNGLNAIVKRARANLRFLPRSIAQSEDFFLRLWNFYARNNLKIEWGAFVVLVVYGLSKARIFSFAGEVTSATIHIGLSAATHALAATQELAANVLSTAPMQSVREQIQFLRMDVESFVDRFQGAMGYKWREFTSVVNNAIPRPNVTEIKLAVRDSGAERSSSALRFLGRARNGWIYMTEDAKNDLARMLTVLTATAAVIAPATTAVIPLTASIPTMTPLGKRLVDQLWAILPEQADQTAVHATVSSVTVASSAAPIADEDVIQSTQDNLPKTLAQSDTQVLLGNLIGTPVVTPSSTNAIHTLSHSIQNSAQTPVSQPAIPTALPSKATSAWWLPSWLGRQSAPINPQRPTTVTVSNAVLETPTTLPVADKYRHAVEPLDSKSSAVESSVSKAVSKLTDPVMLLDATSARPSTRPRTTKEDRYIKVNSKANAWTRKTASKAGKQVDAPRAAETPRTTPTPLSGIIPIGRRVDQEPKVMEESNEIGRTNHWDVDPEANDVKAKIEEAFENMKQTVTGGEDGKVDASGKGSGGGTGTARVDASMKTVTVRPPYETLLLEIGRVPRR